MRNALTRHSHSTLTRPSVGTAAGATRAGWARMALVAALATTLGTSAMADAAFANERATISVVGQGRAVARPDVATLTTGVVSAAKTAEEALAANSKAMEQVIAAIKEAGIEPKDIATSGFGVQPQYSQASRDAAAKLTGYEVRNNVTVRVRDLTALGPLLDKVVSAGANQASGLNFHVADATKMQSEARLEAVKDAMEQAQQVAEAAGLRLVRIRRIAPHGERMPLPPAPMMMKAEMARSVPVEAGESEAQASISMVYEVEPR
ncbi:SIMPL domain-containing protein [Xanthobacteraceae bacterium A53D]